MNEPRYDRLANVLMLVAIGSALAFDSGKFPHIAAGTVGIVTGLAAIALYFVNRSSARKSVAEMETAQSSLSALVSGGPHVPAFADIDNWIIAAARGIDLDALEAYTVRRQHLQRARSRALLREWYLLDVARERPHDISLTPNEVAACAVEIMRTLSTGDEHDRWEFNFGPNGLRIVAKRGQTEKEAKPQADFGFDRISSMVQ